ncbi:BRCA2 and CDKN1A-interacting protein [Alligator mississippiensis]|uniref:BRCA2 and CDKN1A-interacting protein n=1 Tax=Alligator mississippiensis TaxID=8496 RepID=UPI002878037D|nr:BRCA2 and CDKN1A-interacting protein [Alligator mississippiensis]
MATRAKRPAPGPPEPGGDEPDSGSDSDSEEEKLPEEVNIEFEAHSISDNDCNGIKKLLQQLFLKAPVNTSELADILIQQNPIGSVIKQTEVQDDSDDDDGDEDEVFGFISLLNLTERKGTQCAEQIKELILSRCEKNCEQSMVEQLDKLLNDTTKPVGFLLSERFINVPPQIALPMHQQLQKELAETQKTNKPCGKCYYYLMISKTFTQATKSNSKRRGNTQRKEELMFANAEEEFFYEKAHLKFSYSVQEESDTCLGGRWSFDDVPMKPLRTVMLIPADRMNAIMDKLKEYLSV